MSVNSTADFSQERPMQRYTGPIIDAHHHLWDVSLGRHPWLTDPAVGIGALGDISYMRHTYLPADFLKDADGANIFGTVCIEALWDPSRSPVEETEFLETLNPPQGIGRRCIASAPLQAEGVEALLEQHAAYKRVAGVRETIRWHPDPARRWTEAGRVKTPAFRRGVRCLGKFGFVLELLMNPYQSGEVARLAADFPDQQFIINHCGTPIDRDDAGIARWKTGMQLMAERPNIAIKVSNFGAYGTDKSLPALCATVMACVEAFGTTRAMYGSDYPVGRRNMTMRAMIDAFAEIISAFSADEQRALFHDNAARIYRFES
jgi:predicted TIM-barrel fold metal-dependent hydrolase